MLIKLIRELIILTMLLIVAISALLVNLSLKPDDSNLKPEKEQMTEKPVPIVNQVGKQLFKANCAACHNRNMIDRMTGPALGGAVERWVDNDVSIEEFIRNAPLVLSSGNVYANQLRSEFGIEMTAFPNLSDEEIEAILGYVEEMYQRNR